MSEELKLIKLTQAEVQKLPTGFQKIYVKKIISRTSLNKVKVYSEKYDKVVFEAFNPNQPVSKLIK